MIEGFSHPRPTVVKNFPGQRLFKRSDKEVDFIMDYMGLFWSCLFTCHLTAAAFVCLSFSLLTVLALRSSPVSVSL